VVCWLWSTSVHGWLWQFAVAQSCDALAYNLSTGGPRPVSLVQLFLFVGLVIGHVDSGLHHITS
jgi:hypothetical protein